MIVGIQTLYRILPAWVRGLKLKVPFARTIYIVVVYLAPIHAREHTHVIHCDDNGSGKFVRNTKDGLTCKEAGYDDITSEEQCEAAFKIHPRHPEVESKTDHVSSWWWCFDDICCSTVVAMVFTRVIFHYFAFTDTSCMYVFFFVAEA